MISLLVSVYSAVCSSFRTRAALQLEILALRHQINVLRRVTARACTPAPRGPVPLDLAFALLAKLALGPGHRQTGNRDRLAFARDSGFIGPGRAVTDKPAGRD